MPQPDHRPIASASARRCFFLVLIAFTLLQFGCASGTSRKTAAVKSAKNLKSSAAELSARNQSLLGRYSAEIENAADKVIFASPSPVARRQALVWKAEAIPVLQQSLLNVDPVTAVFDAWVFVFQMKAYMAQPPVKQGFGESHTVVDETLERMDTEMQGLVRAAAPSADLMSLRQKAVSWAEAHPLLGGLAGRESVDAEVIRKLGETKLGTMAAIQALGESLGDLTARLDAYSAYLPKQARWQEELLLSDLARTPQASALISNFSTITDALAKTSGTVEKMPELSAEMRKAVEAERLAIQDFVRAEREQAFNSVAHERVALLSGVDRERQAITADLRGERQIVLQAVHNEREAAINDVRTAGDQALQDFDAKARGLINHFFLRAFELMLVTLALGALVTWLLLRRFTRRRPDRGQVLYDRAA